MIVVLVVIDGDEVTEDNIGVSIGSVSCCCCWGGDNTNKDGSGVVDSGAIESEDSSGAVKSEIHRYSKIDIKSRVCYKKRIILFFGAQLGLGPNYEFINIRILHANIFTTVLILLIFGT